MTRHTKGTPFSPLHLQAGEELTDTGAIRRGHYLILTDPDGYRVMEDFDAHRLSRVYRESLAKTRLRVDRLTQATTAQ